MWQFVVETAWAFGVIVALMLVVAPGVVPFAIVVGRGSAVGWLIGTVIFMLLYASVLDVALSWIFG